MLSPDTRSKAQSIGRFLSNLVMPNIAAFIAWGLFAALFIPTGWIPNQDLAQFVEPMISNLIPLLIGYTGGRLIAGERGAVVGAIMTTGLIVGASVPMLIGAMLVGPLGGLAIKAFDNFTAHRVKHGFEMLINNFSAGIIGMLGAIIAYYVVGPAIVVLSAMLTAGVEALVDSGTLVLVAILVEPAKVLFLNNAINHGVFSPLGIQQVEAVGHSIFFLIESNPGPGLGILLAYVASTKGQMKQTAAGATLIHFFGGIQEVYFPYVMMKPRLILALIIGSMSGIAVLMLFNAGLVSAASPGSIVSVILMTPKDSLIGVGASVIVSTLVSFAMGLVIIKFEQTKEQRQKQAEQKQANRSGNYTPVTDTIELFELAPQKEEQKLSITADNISLGLSADTKQQAIQFAGEKLLQLGYVNEEYIAGMHKREALLSTYLGEGIALPHGVIGEKQNVLATGIVVCQYPDGVEWGSEPEDRARLVIAIAARGDKHIHVISAVSSALDDDEVLQQLTTTSDVDDVIRILNKN
ncbi:PTS sugar transporter subunit IIA [Vibrio hippocampi]|uniref:PTS system mannitol-specific EIICBA component n=1 Tax=Vibrio hippocampi TaxID=654686 RepID=A0ABN8DJG5_9VIBR|nr:PTS sugar transporter subunit IIA [Vibrio hippocampi]CAH0529455.1 hypothetical protein VHP8226_03228 [Vibrio hippocampi]